MSGTTSLIPQLGRLIARRWAERIAEIGFVGREVMVLRHVALKEGRTQSAVAEAIGIPSSRIVALVDSLEGKGWLVRSHSTTDRRARALHLTSAGHAAMKRIRKVSLAHETEFMSGLTGEERAQLVALLRKAAAAYGLVGVHEGPLD